MVYESIEHVFRVGGLCKGEKESFFCVFGRDFEDGCREEKMRVLLVFSDDKDRDVVERVKSFLMGVWERRDKFLNI